MYDYKVKTKSEMISPIKAMENVYAKPNGYCEANRLWLILVKYRSKYLYDR
jgi:hypothetical protein